MFRFVRGGLCGAVCLLALASACAAKSDWDPIDPADLAATVSTSSPGSDLEYLVWRIELLDKPTGTVTEKYVRAKIYTPRGVEDAGFLCIPYPEAVEIRRLAARVIKRDGTIVDLKKSDFFTDTLLKTGDVKLKKTTFAFPSLSPGDLIEYRWIEDVEMGLANMWFFCQAEAPVRDFKFAIESRFAQGANVACFNVKDATITKPDRTSLELQVRNLPAFVAENLMGAERDHRGWLRVVYSTEDDAGVEGWKEHARACHEFFEINTKPNDALRKKAAELTAGASGDEEKLRKLYDFCQTEIVNLRWDDTPEAREARKESPNEDFQSARQTLQRKRGWVNEITFLFGGLARAAGYEPRHAKNAMRNKITKIGIPHGWDFMDETAVAIKLDGKWQYYAPGEAFLPFGYRHRFDEGAMALVCDPKLRNFDRVPVSPANRSILTRKARFSLSNDGELTGEVEEANTGHLAIVQKINAFGDEQQAVDKRFKEMITDRLPAAEVTDLEWENLRNRNLPLIVRYKVKVPGYAEVAGQRLIVVTRFFAVGAKALFVPEKRTYPIVFNNTWTESDDIEIKIPEGFTLEEATAPSNVRERTDLQTAEYRLAFLPKRRTLRYSRNFSWGVDGSIAFKSEAYDTIKYLFDKVAKSDAHSIVLCPVAATASPSAASVPAAVDSTQGSSEPKATAPDSPPSTQ